MMPAKDAEREAAAAKADAERQEERWRNMALRRRDQAEQIRRAADAERSLLREDLKNEEWRRRELEVTAELAKQQREVELRGRWKGWELLASMKVLNEMWMSTSDVLTSTQTIQLACILWG